MGYTKNTKSKMHKALRIIALMVLVGYMSAGLIKLPKQICKPAKKIGYLIANGVTKCAAKYGISARRLAKCNFETSKDNYRCGASFGGRVCRKGRYCSKYNICGSQAFFKNTQQSKYSNANGCKAVKRAPKKKTAPKRTQKYFEKAGKRVPKVPKNKKIKKATLQRVPKEPTPKRTPYKPTPKKPTPKRIRKRPTSGKGKKTDKKSGKRKGKKGGKKGGKKTDKKVIAGRRKGKRGCKGCKRIKKTRTQSGKKYNDMYIGKKPTPKKPTGKGKRGGKKAVKNAVKKGG